MRVGLRRAFCTEEGCGVRTVLAWRDGCFPLDRSVNGPHSFGACVFGVPFLNDEELRLALS